MLHEVRFRGEWMGFFESADDANDFVGKRNEPDARHRKDYEVAPARRFHVVCRGNVVTTVDEPGQGGDVIRSNATPTAPQEAWQIVDSTTGQVVELAPPAPPEGGP